MDPHLALSADDARTVRIVQAYDPRLRLRKSVDLPEYWVLEIESLKGCPVDPTELDGRDLAVAAADNYLHISYVHSSYFHKPERIIEELKKADLWMQHGRGERAVASAEGEIADAEAIEKAKRRRTRRDWLNYTAREAFDILNRTGGVGGTERTRFNSPGLNDSSLTGDPATHGGSDERPATTSVRACAEPDGASPDVPSV